LLKNESSILPFGREKQRKIAVIGPNAKLQIVTGGGSASLRAIRSSSPLEGILEAAEKNSVEVQYTPGIFAHKFLPLVDPLISSPRRGKGYMDLDFFTSDPKESKQDPIHTVDVDTANNFMVSVGFGAWC
jgi:beta-glucosidase